MWTFKCIIVVGLHAALISYGIEGEEVLSKTFNIAGVFPRVLSAPALAAAMAIEDINRFASSTGRNSFNNITLTAGETGCDPHTAATLMYQIMSYGPAKSVLIAGCPDDCEMISNAAPIWNAITICYGISQAPYYGTRLNVPSLFLAQPHLNSIIPALVKFIPHFGWKRVAVLHQDYEEYTDTALQLTSHLWHHGTEVVQIETDSTEEDPTHFLDQIERDHLRIILTLGSESFSREILCQIYHRGLFGEKYVWFFLGSHRKQWFLPRNSSAGAEGATDGEEDSLQVPNIRQLDCEPEELTEAAEGHFTAEPLLWNPNEGIKTVSGMTVKEFKAKLVRKLRETGGNAYSDFKESPLAYDSVWAAYLALNQTRPVDCKAETEGKGPCEFAYDNYRFETHKAMVKGLRFRGVSGEVSFDKEGKRSIGNACIKISRFKNMGQEPIAWHFNYNNTFSWKTNPFDKKDIPEDGSKFQDTGNPSFVTTTPPESSSQKCSSAHQAGMRRDNLFPLFPIICSTISVRLIKSLF